MDKWTEKDVKFVEDNISKLNHYQIAEKLGRTPTSVRHKINRFGINTDDRVLLGDENKWSDDEDKRLIKNKNKTIKELIIMFPNRTRSGILSRKTTINATTDITWSEEEISIIYKNQNKTDKKIGKLTGRSESSVKTKRQRLGLLKKENKMWTRDEVKFLTENYSMNHDKLADILGISKKRLREKLTRMGLIETGEPGRPWTKEERIKLKEKHKTTNSIKNISELFQDRTFYSVCGEVRKLPIQPKEKYKMENGYIKILINNKYVFQHRRVMQPLDKTLTKFDIIHHLDYDKTNNFIKNLVVLTNSQHRTVHGTANKLISPLMEAGYIQYDFTNQVYKTSKSILTFEARKKIAISFKTNIYYIPTNKQRDVVGMLPKTNVKHTSSKKPWTPEEIRIITDTSNATYLKLCILLPDRTYKAITNKASRLGIVIRNNIKSFGFISGRGYRVLWVNGEKLLEHRGVMALKLGRMLEDHEIVHHVDHIKYNNKIWNLDLFENHSKHKIAEYSFNKCMPELFKRKIVSYSKKTRSYKLGKNF